MTWYENILKSILANCVGSEVPKLGFDIDCELFLRNLT
jgi:hypothetical protein